MFNLWFSIWNEPWKDVTSRGMCSVYILMTFLALCSLHFLVRMDLKRLHYIVVLMIYRHRC